MTVISKVWKTESNKPTIWALLDFKKEFDTIQHGILYIIIMVLYRLGEVLFAWLAIQKTIQHEALKALKYENTYIFVVIMI